MTLTHWLTLGIACAAVLRIWLERRQDNRETSRQRQRLYKGHL